MMSSKKGETITLGRGEEAEVRDRGRLRSPVIYEIIRREGEEELTRPASSLSWSGFAAGIAIGFSVLSQAILKAYLPDAPSSQLIETLGYSVGFLIVILARLQLFTENTITVVLPVLLNPSIGSVARTGRLWGIVLAANLVGCLVFAAALLVPGLLGAEVLEAALAISRHMMSYTIFEMFVKGIFAGWLIASLVWILPTAKSASFWIIVLLTYLIAVGGFTHVVAGSVEGFLLVLNGEISIATMALGFFVPTLLGNIVGGTGLFALLTYGQVSGEI